MPAIGIKKYDKLPGRVSWIDVDYLRYRLERNLKENKDIMRKLEKARSKVKSNAPKN